MAIRRSVEVNVRLPFLLRARGPFKVRYEDICIDPQLPKLNGQWVTVTFDRRPSELIDNSGMNFEHSTVIIRVFPPAPLDQDEVSTFAITECLKIINHIIMSYQAATGEFGNAGYISPLGTSDMQLFPAILVDGADFRDRWPGHSYYNMPLSVPEERDMQDYLAGKPLPVVRLLSTNAALLLNRGQYSACVIQAATSVEVGLTQYIRDKLSSVGWSAAAISPYEIMTLGAKLNIPGTDPRSLDTYCNGISGFTILYGQLKSQLVPVRNSVAHRGHLATKDEAIAAVDNAADFLKLLSVAP